MSVTQFDSSTPFKLTLSVPAEVVGGEVQLTEENFVPVGTGAVQSVFGRTGAVAAAADDYAASEVENDSAVAGAQVSDALDTLKAAAQAAQDDATQALQDSQIVWITAYFADITNDTGFVDIPPPVAGTLTAFRVVAMRAPNDGMTFTATIGSQVLTGNAVSIGDATPAGTIVSTTVGGANTVTTSTAVRVTLTTGNSNAGGATILLGFTRT